MQPILQTSERWPSKLLLVPFQLPVPLHAHISPANQPWPSATTPAATCFKWQQRQAVDTTAAKFDRSQ